MSMQIIVLKYLDYAQQIALDVQDFLLKETFTDVSVTTSSKFSIRCHKMVLSSVSPLLRTLIEQNERMDDELTSILLPDVSNQDLERLIAFIYTGLVTNINDEDRKSFCQLLNSLQIHFPYETEEKIINFCQLPTTTECLPPTPPTPPSNTHFTNDDNNNFFEDPNFNWSLAESYIFEDDVNYTTIDKSAILYNFNDHHQTEPLTPTSNSSSSSSSSSSDSTIQQQQEIQIENLLILNQSDNQLKNTNQCSHCGKCFPSQRYRLFHEKNVHNKIKSVSCSICSKVFTGEYYLRQHKRRMHSTERPYSCSKCPVSFSVRYDLVVHSRTHEQIKPFACDLCPKRYATARALREHVRTHTGERPFPCPDCGKRFALPKTLRVHYRQHSGERPYLCPDCGRTFVQNSTLKNHIRKHH